MQIYLIFYYKTLSKYDTYTIITWLPLNIFESVLFEMKKETIKNIFDSAWKVWFFEKKICSYSKASRDLDLLTPGVEIFLKTFNVYYKRVCIVLVYSNIICVLGRLFTEVCDLKSKYREKRKYISFFTIKPYLNATHTPS